MTPESALKQVRRDGNTGTTSQKKVEANRRNAQLSTGPTSAEGKETSSLNASKHGLLAKDVVITNRRTKEDQAEFDGLLAEMRDCYRPVGIAEDLLVREMTISYWRSARALRCERGHVTCAIGAPDESELSELEITILTGKSPADAHRSLLESSRGIKFLLSKWEEGTTNYEFLVPRERRCLAGFVLKKTGKESRLWAKSTSSRRWRRKPKN